MPVECTTHHVLYEGVWSCMKVCGLRVVQCRKYKASEKVRRRADVIYHKFKKLFTVKDGDDFTKVGHFVVHHCQLLNLVYHEQPQRRVQLLWGYGRQSADERLGDCPPKGESTIL